MARVLFISEEKLKAQTAVNEQVDPRELRTAIQTAQDINVQNTLGQRLYDQIQDQIIDGSINDPSPFNVANKFLLNEYIQPLTIHYAYFYALDNFMVKFMAVGLVQNRSESGNPPDLKTFEYLKNNARDTAQWYDNLIRKYLCANQDLYPQYTIDNGDGKLAAERFNPFGKGMTLPFPVYCKNYDLFVFGSNVTAYNARFVRYPRI